MRGRPTFPTGQEKKPVGSTVSNPPFLQGKVGYRVAPSSATVCALGHLPPKGKAWGVETQRGGNVLSQKCFFSIFFPENASQIGLRISEEIVPRTDQSQPSPNPASGNERLSKPGVQGACPGPLSPHVSGEMGTPAGQAGPRGAAPRGREKPRPPVGYALPEAPGPPAPPGGPMGSGPNLDPRPGPGGNPPRRFEPAAVLNRTTCRRQPRPRRARPPGPTSRATSTFLKGGNLYHHGNPTRLRQHLGL